ncbi:MAG: DMT family transporter [Alphaproteobacteria bacterium]
MSEAHPRNIVIGISCAVGGAVALSLNDLFIKQLSGSYALHQVILVRALVGVAFILGVIAVSGMGWQALRTGRPVAHLIRASIVMVSNVTYFLGLAALPLANAAAIGFIAPVLVTIISAVVLHEPVGWHRWAAVGTGLLGVVFMLHPEGTFHWASVLILISAACYATTQNMTRYLKDTESAVTINFYTQIAFIVVSVGMGFWVGDGHLAGSSDASLAFLFRVWHWPPVPDWGFFVGTGVAVAAGGMLMGHAYRTNPPALIAPFEYTSMPLSVIYGLVFFGTFPDAQGWVGIALIIGSGLYTLWRETVRRHEGSGSHL